MFATVPGVPAAPPAYGLVASAERPNTTAPEWERWEQGLAWIPERCGTAYQLAPWCVDPDNEAYDRPRPGSAYYRPVEHRHADECTTMGGPLDLDRVRRVADAQSQFVIARELWSGTATKADPHELPGGGDGTNAHLASPDADTVGASAADPLVGFGRLEQAALETSHGQPVQLHVPVLLLPLLADVFRVVGSQLVTYAGNELVADGGYPGTGPDGEAVGATAWIYATSPVLVLTSDWVIDPDDASRVDRATNTRTTWASRVFAAAYDPCVHLATEITI